ncbi:MAG: alkaline phosphatase PhoX [Actinomycetota bacterium]
MDDIGSIPYKEMGRFSHEALVVDPGTGFVYETEDNGPSGFYRFIPRRRGDLALGGKLQMLKAKGAPNYDTSTGQTVGEALPTEWVAMLSFPDNITFRPRGGLLLRGLAERRAVLARPDRRRRDLRLRIEPSRQQRSGPARVSARTGATCS